MSGVMWVGSCREGIYSGSLVGQVSRCSKELTLKRKIKHFGFFVNYDQLRNTCAHRVQVQDSDEESSNEDSQNAFEDSIQCGRHQKVFTSQVPDDGGKFKSRKSPNCTMVV
jgi:hypothetical protein